MWATFFMKGNVSTAMVGEGNKISLINLYMYVDKESLLS